MKAASSSATTLLDGASVGGTTVPEHWAAAAVTSLLDLQDRQMVEGGMADLVLPIARNLSALPVGPPIRLSPPHRQTFFL